MTTRLEGGRLRPQWSNHFWTNGRTFFAASLMSPAEFRMRRERNFRFLRLSSTKEMNTGLFCQKPRYEIFIDVYIILYLLSLVQCLRYPILTKKIRTYRNFFCAQLFRYFSCPSAPYLTSFIVHKCATIFTVSISNVLPESKYQDIRASSIQFYYLFIL